MKVIKLKAGKAIKTWVAGQRPHVVIAVTGSFASNGVAMTLMEAMAVRTAIDGAIVELSKRLERVNRPPPTEGGPTT